MEIENCPHSTKIRIRCAQHSIHLPQPIIKKVLSKLPAKSLSRFSCVSKSWRSLIRSQGFIKTHHKNSIKNPSFHHQRVLLHNMRHMPEQCSLQSLLNDPSSIHPSPLDVPINIRLKLSKVVGCHNGLVCILEQPQKLFIWNPSTRISKKLPEIGSGYCVENYGFGRVESSGEYKVFTVVSGFDKYVVLVYSSKTKSWKAVRQLESPFNCEEGVFVDGKLHWHFKFGIAVFDLKSEKFEQIRSPNDRKERLNKALGVVGGCLCMLYYHQIGIRVWVMKGEFWERVASPRHVLELLERPFSAPFTVGQNGEVLLFHGSTFLIYSPRDNVFRCPKIFCDYEFHHLYVESLVSPEQCF